MRQWLRETGKDRRSRRQRLKREEMRKKQGETVNSGRQRQRQGKNRRRDGAETQRTSTEEAREPRAAGAEPGTGKAGDRDRGVSTPALWLPTPRGALTSLARPGAPGVSTALPLLRPPPGQPLARLASLRGVPRRALLPPCALLAAVRSRAALPAAAAGAGPERGSAGGGAGGEAPGGSAAPSPPTGVSPSTLPHWGEGALESCRESFQGQ